MFVSAFSALAGCVLMTILPFGFFVLNHIPITGDGEEVWLTLITFPVGAIWGFSLAFGIRFIHMKEFGWASALIIITGLLSFFPILFASMTFLWDSSIHVSFNLVFFFYLLIPTVIFCWGLFLLIRRLSYQSSNKIANSG
jgi:hypothetical protein